MNRPLASLDTRSVELARHVDRVCSRFEAAWKAGQRPHVEDYLPVGPQAERSALLSGLIPLEAEYRRRLGEEPAAEEYYRRFPAVDPVWLAEAVAAPAPVTDEPPGSLTPGGTAECPGAVPTPPLVCPSCGHPLGGAGRGGEAACPGCGSTFRRRDPQGTGPLTAGQLLGRFRLVEQVGAGGFGVVWRAQDTKLDRVVALKVPHPGLLAAPACLERFHREARAAARLRHPGIVTVHEAVVLEGLPAIVSDFVDGVALAELLRARRLTFRESATLVAEAAEALDYAHGMGLVHRDVKPGNILLEGDGSDTDRTSAGVGRARVADFGLALREGDEVTLTLEGQVLGTPAYMSPEQAAGRGHQVDRRSDVYSLGVVLYELLCGEVPFRGSRARILHQVLNEEPRPPRQLNDKVPRDLETVCRKCLEKEPARRYATAGELADDLRRWLRGEPVVARPAGRWERLWRWCRRNPAVATLAGTLVALLVAVAVGATVAAYHFASLAGREQQAKQQAEENAGEVRRQMERLQRTYRLVERGHFEAGQGQPGRALADYTEAITLRPDNPLAWSGRGRCYGVLNLWDLAAEDMAKAFELHASSEVDHWFTHASLRLYVGDTAGYRRVCARLFKQFDAPSPRTGWWIVCTCTLAPSGVDPGRLAQLAEAAVATDPGSHPYRLWLGAAQYRAGRFEQALRTLKEVTRFGDGWTNSEAWPLLAMVHHRLGNAPEARRWLDRTRRGFEQTVWDVHLHPYTPFLFSRNDIDPLAVYLLYREAGEVVTGSPVPDHPLRWIVQGRGHASLGQLDRALASFTRAIELRPEDPTLWLARAWFHAGQARWHQAEADFARASALPPPDRPGAHWDWHSHALLRLYLGQTEGYRQLCRQTLQLFGRVKDPWPAQQLALVSFLAPDAVPDLNVPAQLAEQALASDPWNPWFLLTLGAARHRTGFPAEAILYLRCALKQPWPDPGFRESGTAIASLLLSLSYQRLGQAGEARRWLDRAVRRMAPLRPGEDTGLLCADYVVWMIGEVLRREAEALLTASPAITSSARPAARDLAALEPRPKEARAWLSRGYVYARQGQWDRAAADFARAFDLRSENHWDWYCHALLRLRRGDTAGYCRVCRQLCERFGHSKHSWACQQLALVCLLAPDAIPDVGMAARLAEVPLASEPHNPWFLLTLGAARYRVGQHWEAIRLLRQALREQWGDEEGRACGTPLTRLFLSLAHHRLGEVGEARQQLKEAARGIADMPRREGESDLGRDWHIWAACEILLREAEAVVKGKVREPDK